MTANHVSNGLSEIMRCSKIVSELVNTGKCGLIGGIQEISTGVVNFHTHTRLGFFANTPSDDMQQTETPKSIRPML